LFKSLHAWGRPVQYSVFEFDLKQSQREKLRQKIKGIIDPTEDKVRLYELCGSCLVRVEVIGEGEITKTESVYVV